MNYIVKPVPCDYNTKIRFIEELIREYPFLSAEIIGRSALGRGIFSLSVGNCKNSVIYVSGFHGSEWASGELLLLFTESVCRSIKYGRLLCGIDIKRAFSQLGITVVPFANPDGTEIFLNGFESAPGMRKYLLSLDGSDREDWNANAHGVDICRNFSVLFKENLHMAAESGVTSPCCQHYGGEHPESEAETRALTRLCRLRKFRQCMVLHGQGEKILWQTEGKAPGQSEMMAKILADSCGYSLAEDTLQRVDSGFMEWFIDEFSLPGFTIKPGRENHPPEAEDIYDIYKKTQEALTLFSLM